MSYQAIYDAVRSQISGGEAVIVQLKTPALFIPLKGEFYDGFVGGWKTEEFRICALQWGKILAVCADIGGKYSNSGEPS